MRPRFGRGVVVPGGVTQPPSLAPGAALGRLASIEADLRADVHLLMATSSFVDRLRSTGVLAPHIALSRGALGPVGRASGLEEDVRDVPALRPLSSHRYARASLLAILATPSHASSSGTKKRGEPSSFAVAPSRRSLDSSAGRTVAKPGQTGGRDWLGLGRSSAGRAALSGRRGRRSLRRVKPRSASFHNLSLFPDVFTGDIFTDFAFIEASFGLSMAGVAN